MFSKGCLVKTCSITYLAGKKLELAGKRLQDEMEVHMFSKDCILRTCSIL